MTDPQSEAFREMTANDAVTDREIARMILSGELISATEDEEIRSPEQWDETGWDQTPEPDDSWGP